MHARDIAEYLAAIERFDGEATTTQIRAETGLSNRQVNYRHRELASKHYVDVENPGADPITGEPRAKTATLTGEGERWLDKHRHYVEAAPGELTVTKSTLDSLDSEIRQLHQRIDVVVSMLDEGERARSDALDTRLNNIDATLEDWCEKLNDTVVPQMRRNTTRIEELEDGIDSQD